MVSISSAVAFTGVPGVIEVVCAVIRPEVKKPPVKVSGDAALPEMRMVRVLSLGSTGAAAIVPRLMKLKPPLAVSAESTAMAKELKRRGFRFVGPTTGYALMQATGMVNDHLPPCWRA